MITTHCSEGHGLVFICEEYDDKAHVYVGLLICPTCWAGQEDYEYMDQRAPKETRPFPAAARPPDLTR